MKKIVFATANVHKLKEVREMLGDGFQIVSLTDIDFHEDIPETGDTLEENASIKSHYILDRYNIDCFADDTGLEVDALGGAPGVYSARYAGENATYDDNVNKLLSELNGVTQREARFRTVISLLLDGKEYFFDGSVEGHIIDHKLGSGGFGYDPVFIPDGFDKTFSEMAPETKNAISHRGRAIRRLADFLKSNFPV
jgi:XTP/dITP diphosphohydrolase